MTEDEIAVRDRLLTGDASLEEAMRLYGSLLARGELFPLPWEQVVLRLALSAYPDRSDLRERLVAVDRELAPAPAIEAPETQLAAALARFGRLTLTEDGDRSARAQEDAFGCAALILANPAFASLPVSEQVAAFGMLHGTLMSRPSPDWLPIAELGYRQFRRLLQSPDLTEPQACRVYDVLLALTFAAAKDVRDLRRFDSECVGLFEGWLLRRVPRRDERSVSPEGVRRLAYLLHVAHFERGNAVAPLIASLAKAHATRPGRKIFLYAVQWVGEGFTHVFEGAGVTLRVFPQDARYDRLDDIAAQLESDEVDAVITEQNLAVAAALFTRRVAPLQLWADTGFPFWSLVSLDWTLLPAKEATGAIGVDPDRSSPLRWRRHALDASPPANAAAAAELRQRLPPGAFVLGVFCRLVKITPSFLDMMAGALRSRPSYHLLIVGPGDPSHIRTFMARPEAAGRVTFIEGMVDLGLYGRAIDVMCDTFPFIGGNACRDVAALGTPVVSMLGNAWDRLLIEDRNPELLARTPDQYLGLIERLRLDEGFRNRQSEIARSKAAILDDPSDMVDDVEAALLAAAGARRGEGPSA